MQGDLTVVLTFIALITGVELDVLEASLSSGSLKSWGLDVGSKPFTSQGEARSWGSLPFVWCLVNPGVCVLAFRIPFYEVFFFFIYRSDSASFWISFRGNFSSCSYTFSVFMGGRKLRSLLSPSWSTPPGIS